MFSLIKVMGKTTKSFCGTPVHHGTQKMAVNYPKTQKFKNPQIFMRCIQSSPTQNLKSLPFLNILVYN
jgi:hypothetical protein